MWKSAIQQKVDEFQVKSFGMVCSDKDTSIRGKLAASWAHMCMDEVRQFGDLKSLLVAIISNAHVKP